MRRAYARFSRNKGKECKSAANRVTDAGSALPLLIASVVFLILLGAVLIGSLQLLEQQRRLNGASDTLALDLTQELVASPGSNVQRLTNFAADDIRLIWPGRAVRIGQIEILGEASVGVTLCEPARLTLASVVGMAANQVCAHSRAQLH